MSAQSIRSNNTKAFNKYHVAVKYMKSVGLLESRLTNDEQANAILELEPIHVYGVKVEVCIGKWNLYPSRTNYMKSILSNEDEVFALICNMADGKQTIKIQPYIEHNGHEFFLDGNLALQMQELKHSLRKIAQ